MDIRDFRPLPPEAVLFDMDGVIADTRTFHWQAFRELAAEFDIDLSDERFRELFGLGNDALIPKLLGRELSPERVDELADRKEARYRALIGENITLLPGVRELIDWLVERNVRVALVSSAPVANVSQILATTQLEERFAVRLGAEDVSRRKPDPEAFLTAANRLSVEPSRSWVIEDTGHGLEAAKRGGFFAIAVTTTRSRDRLGQADVVFDRLDELLEELRDAVGR